VLPLRRELDPSAHDLRGLWRASHDQAADLRRRRALPHLRADACEACRRYLITIDLRKEPEAVPVVDELVALPLDLYVKARGFTKIVPNLMAIG